MNRVAASASCNPNWCETVSPATASATTSKAITARAPELFVRGAERYASQDRGQRLGVLPNGRPHLSRGR